MAEAAKVRLVRCPKCENLLPELPDFSLYQCGGCGAVLRAKKKGILEDGLTKISDDVEGGGASEEGSIVKVSEVNVESADGNGGTGGERIQREGVASNGSSITGAENREVMSDSDIGGRGKERMRRRESFDEECMSYSQDFVRNRNQGKTGDLNVDRPEYVHFHGEHVKEIRPPMESVRSRPAMDQWAVKSNGPMASYRPAEGAPARVRFDDFLYHDEGQTSYDGNSYYQQGERARYQGHDLDERARLENLENGRAELLRRLDELKDQLSRSCEVSDKAKERIGTDRRMVSPTSPNPCGRQNAAYVQEGLTSSQCVNQQSLARDDMVPPYLSYPRGFVPYTDRYGSRVPDMYPQRGYPHEFLHYSGTYEPEMLRRPSRQPQSKYMQRPYYEHFPGYYGDANHDLFMLHRHENFFHQPACSCVHCCDKNWRIPPTVEPTGMHNHRSQIEPSSLNSHQHPNPILHRGPGDSSRGSNLHPLRSRQSLTLDSNDLDSDIDGFKYHRPRKLMVAHRNGRVSHPIAGGAPFITCSNCFELLKLPRKHISLAKHEQKLKCGACSSIISFELGNKGFTASISAHVDQATTEIDEGSIGTVDENVRYWDDDSNGANMDTCNDYDDSQHKFSAAGNKSDSSESEKQTDPVSSTSSLPQDERRLENILSRKHGSQSEELPMTTVKSVADPDFSPQEFSDHSLDNIAVSRFDKRNKSKRPDQERVSLGRTASQQNSVKDAAVATEIDVPFNEYSNSYASQDSAEISKEDHPKANKGGESFLAGLIRKGFRDFTKSNQGVEAGGSKVSVNGHCIPDRLVKKAEKLAGPIQPGEYCFLVILIQNANGSFANSIKTQPNIEEFNYPLPENCSAGNTGVFVNGRELNQKDLDLLASRGLPITRNRSYLIEITGKVIDEQTGEELDGLGKLAPTVERAKHGFGMKVPRFIAQSQS
ncbi:UNVERIFIED_CONTAM: protein ENHANCED DISEASE RESISTANCE 4 [Sesamum radiatum]|uniref:Protein ENHANCED DISEASE RESISTANCE 4 n=1 Tax=Sesamum radiatum TaxID=300843 RepID=A0AAW2TT38_SESRA